jgi:Protein of unknown function (DUF2442)
MNKIIPYLKKAEARPGYRLFVEFEDGVKGLVDMSDKVGKGVFEYLKDESNFSKVYVSEHGSISWSDELEIDTLNVYLKLTHQTFAEYAGS